MPAEGSLDCPNRAANDTEKKETELNETNHILYVRDCLCNTTAVIGNTKAYTLTALYNALATMEQYYSAIAGRDWGKM